MYIISFLHDITDNECARTVITSNMREKYGNSFTSLDLPTDQFMNLKITKETGIVFGYKQRNKIQ
jgi:hypothetical protein